MARASKVEIDEESLVGKYLFDDIIDAETGEALVESNTLITEDVLANIKKNAPAEISILRIDDEMPDTSIRDTIAAAKITSEIDAIREIYKGLRPGDPPTPDIARSLFVNLFFNTKR